MRQRRVTRYSARVAHFRLLGRFEGLSWPDLTEFCAFPLPNRPARHCRHAEVRARLFGDTLPAADGFPDARRLATAGAKASRKLGESRPLSAPSGSRQGP